MSLHRRAAKRDSNEPAIVSALEALGCIVWRVSGKGLPDLIVLRSGKKWLADVKAAKKGVTEPQAELWEEAATKARCAVFILRTPEDAQKMLNNALQPWEPPLSPADLKRGLEMIAKTRRAHEMKPSKGDAAKAGGMSVPHNGRDAKKACGCLRSLGRCEHSGNYTPPRSAPVDAAKEAEATFAPPPFQHHSRCTYEGGGLCSCPAGWKG